MVFYEEKTPEEQDIARNEEQNICVSCEHIYHCRKSRRDTRDCENYKKKKDTKCKRIETVSLFKTCVECDCEMRYCKECHVYHHTDSFKKEHMEMQKTYNQFFRLM